MAAQAKLTIPIGFAMVGEEGTQPLRDVAQHVADVGDAWHQVSDAMGRLADKLDDLVTHEPVADNPEPGP